MEAPPSRSTGNATAELHSAYLANLEPSLRRLRLLRTVITIAFVAGTRENVTSLMRRL